MRAAVLPSLLLTLSLGATAPVASAAPAPNGSVAAAPIPNAATGHPILPRPRPPGARAAAASPLASVPPADGSLTAQEVERLRASLRWAAEQGFIGGGKDPDSPQPGHDPAKAMPPSPPPANLTNVQQRPGEPEAAPGAPAETAQTDPPASAEAAPVCAGPPGTPLVDWPHAPTDRRGFLAAIGRQRAEIAARTDAGTLHDLALFYLSEGFTQEALASLIALGTTPRPLLDAVRILLDRADRTGDTLADQVACYSDGAVWRAAWFAAHNRAAEALAASRDALAPLAAFPKHPRTVMALALARIALDHDDLELAEELLALVDPAPAQNVVGPMAALRGRLALMHGRPNRADWYFSQALAAGGDAARQVRLFRIRHALAAGAPLPERASDEMRSALFDYRGDRRLLSTALLAADVHAAQGHFPAALEALGDAAERLPPEISLAPIVAKARSILEAAFADPSAMSVADALQLFADDSHFLADNPAGVAVRTKLARRMLSVGLPSAATQILAPLTGAAVTATVRLMRAEARLRSGQAEQALAALRAPPALTGPSAEDLERQALARLGR
ncbi:MAG: hypothetical protein KDC18_09270, partial [Alphaproteobacteria bacterium]|nr:hypothetical protein [Alphaproteobacteria bacterium]